MINGPMGKNYASYLGCHTIKNRLREYALGLPNITLKSSEDGQMIKR